MSSAQLASELTGNTLRVYWCLVNSSTSLGSRDVQRKLGFSSPNLAVYHLDKLVDLGVAEKVNGEYSVTQIVDVGILKQFTKIKGFMFPRQLIFASMWTSLFIFFLYEFRDINFYSVFGFILGVIGLVILWFEAVSTWKNRPI